MDEWEEFNETSLPEEEFYSNLIWKISQMQTKKVCKDFEIKNLGEYHLYLKSDT